MRNKVILLGGNHHNGLGLVRSFGINGILPYGIIIGADAQKGFVRKSKYWTYTWAVQNEQEALEVLIYKFQQEALKPVIIPYSDGAVEIIDMNLNQLKEKFFVPSMNGKQGMLTELMNKQKQAEFAEKIGIRMLHSHVYNLSQISDLNITNYPVVLKPVCSIEGIKADIKICESQKELQKTRNDLIAKGYDRILIQKYIQTKTEYVVTGAINKGFYSFTIVRHIRQWPVRTGSGSFSRLSIDKNMEEYVTDIIKKISDLGFQGPIDIEIFKDNKDVFYVNEFNWRSSGRNFVSLYNKMYSAYWYYCTIVGLKIPTNTINKLEGYTMSEGVDIRHVLCGNISLLEWLYDVKITQNFALWFRDDKRPAISQYMRYLLMFLLSIKR